MPIWLGCFFCSFPFVFALDGAIVYATVKYPGSGLNEQLAENLYNILHQVPATTFYIKCLLCMHWWLMLQSTIRTWRQHHAPSEIRQVGSVYDEFSFSEAGCCCYQEKSFGTECRAEH